MLSYELARQLRDAGFPQNTKLFWQRGLKDTRIGTVRKGIKGTETGAENIQEAFAAPTLEELIEECGTIGFSLVEHQKDKWSANNAQHDIYPAFGKTPKEAVARLWISLNKLSKIEKI